ARGPADRAAHARFLAGRCVRAPPVSIGNGLRAVAGAARGTARRPFPTEPTNGPRTGTTVIESTRLPRAGRRLKFVRENAAGTPDVPASVWSVNAMNKLRWLSPAVWLLAPALLYGQSAPYYQPHFPPEEFKARWDKIFDHIGNRSVVI